MDTGEIKELVRARYGTIAAGCCDPASAGCCGAASSADDAAAQMGYSAGELDAVPESANLGLGCGNPQVIAALRPGDVLVDLGSGAGFDCLLAAHQVGANERVIGVDMTHETLRKARENATKAGASNAEFRLGEIEHLPIAGWAAGRGIENYVASATIEACKPNPAARLD